MPSHIKKMYSCKIVMVKNYTSLRKCSVLEQGFCKMIPRMTLISTYNSFSKNECDSSTIGE